MKNEPINSVGNGTLSVRGYKHKIVISISRNWSPANWTVVKVIKNVYGSKRLVEEYWRKYFNRGFSYDDYKRLFENES